MERNLPCHDHRDERHRLWVSVRSLRAAARRGGDLARCSGHGGGGPVWIPHPGVVALDLCDQRDHGALSECFRRGRAGVSEDSCLARAGSETIGASVRDRATGRPGHLRHRGNLLDHPLYACQPAHRVMRRIFLFFLLLPVALPARAQWTSIGEMPRPSRQGNALRFENAQAVAVVTALSPEIVRVRIRAGRDHSYAVIHRDFGDPHATFSIEDAQSVITTSALRVTIRHAPFRIAFATSGGESLDEDRDIAFSGKATRVWKRLRDDEHIYGLGEKNGPLDKRGWQLGGYSLTMWNSDTFGYDSSTDPIYVSVPFYIAMRKGIGFGLFIDNTYRSNFDIGHQTQGVLSFGAEGGPLDYYFIYGPEPKKVIERYTTLTGRMPL